MHQCSECGLLPACMFAICLAGCGEVAPRAQLLIVVDTNAPVVGQLALDPSLSGDAAIDTIRVEVLGDPEALQLTVPEVSDWPVSFGISGDAPKTARVRVRAFRGMFSQVSWVDDESVVDPTPELAVDRVIDVDFPTSGVRRIGVVLDADCRGSRPSFLDPATTCVDADRTSVAPDVGIVDDPSGATRAGSWAPARDAPCVADPVPGRVCIPGGFSVLGDLHEHASDIADDDPVPLRPVRLSPFWLDELEFSVERFRALVGQGKITTPFPRPYTPADVSDQFCTWLGESDPGNDAYAVSCVRSETAKQACEESGGRLPTEAEWEHAARGRGQRRRVPWGDEIVCCAGSFGRDTSLETGVCGGSGPEPTGASPPTAECNGLGDVSRDGVRDLGGGVTEWTSDIYQPYSAECWQVSPILGDPQCDLASGAHATKGGSWEHGPLVIVSALRGWSSAGPSLGFRCAYDDAK